MDRSHALLSVRLWRQVEKRGPDECWPWTSKAKVRGYGVLGRGGRRGPKVLAHRAAWEVTHGPIPEGPGHHGTIVMHTCDNRLCCNPAHLRLGSQTDNVRDMDRKGRGSRGHGKRGTEHHNSTLTPELVRLFRTSPKTGAQLAREYGINKATVNRIRRGKSWAWVE